MNLLNQDQILLISFLPGAFENGEVYTASFFVFSVELHQFVNPNLIWEGFPTERRSTTPVKSYFLFLFLRQEGDI